MRYLEDFTIGDTFTFEAEPMSSADIMAFAQDWDPQRLHTDVDYATAIHGSLIASGFQTLLHVFRPIMRDLMVTMANIGGLGLDNLRWLRPVRPDEPLAVLFTVTGVTPSRSKPDRGVLAYRIEARNPAGDLVMTLDTATMIRRKPDPAHPNDISRRD